MSGRKRYDDDLDRLPSGMRRVGYDAETQRYTFRHGDDLWLGEPGSLYGGKLKWAGRAPDASQPEEEGEEEYYSETNDPAPPEKSSIEKPLSVSRTSNSQGKNEWGVPVHSMSETNAKPTDGIGPGASLKRRASRFREVASSMIVAQRVVRRFSEKNRPPKVAPGDAGAVAGQLDGEDGVREA